MKRYISLYISRKNFLMQPPTYLLNGPHRRLEVSQCVYTRKQLQIIPDNENPSPNFVIKGKPEWYIPKRILKQRIRKGQLQYLVKWERYPKSEATWEPADSLKEDVPNLIADFLQNIRA